MDGAWWISNRSVLWEGFDWILLIFHKNKSYFYKVESQA